MIVDWFTVDKQGLAKLLDKRGKAFAIFELIQNPWDTRAKLVVVTIEPVPGQPLAHVTVTDDDPDGFKNLAHAFTLFAESEKKGDPTKRGRFNLGEKLVLALCTEATISSTTGTIVFDADGRHASRKRTERGSVFSATMRMTRAEYEEVLTALQTLIPPPDVTTTINGEVLATRAVLREFECTLATEKSNDEGFVRPTTRKTLVTLHEVRPGEVAKVYEMGIPVVETGDRWHVNVHQKVPLNVDRDNVTPSYLRDLRVHVLNATFDMIRGEEQATAAWVRDAGADQRVEPEAFKHVFTERFGERPVIFDPTDREGTKDAMSQGYNVIPGGALSKGEWANVRATGVALPAGKVTPSPKPFTPGGQPLKMLDRDRWTASMTSIAAFASALGEIVIGDPVTVEIANDTGWPFNACYGQRCITFNAGRLGHKWFDRGRKDADVLRLIIHELAHQYASDHLSREYHDALCKVGARVTRAALDTPTLFVDVIASDSQTEPAVPDALPDPPPPVFAVASDPSLPSQLAAASAIVEVSEELHADNASSTASAPIDEEPVYCPACGGHGHRWKKTPPTYEAVETKCDACKGTGHATSSGETVDPKPQSRRR